MSDNTINRIQSETWVPRATQLIETDLPEPDQEGKIFYQVKNGDTLERILKAASRKYKLKSGQNVRTAASQSGIKNPNLIRPGDTIIIYVRRHPEQHTLLASADPYFVPVSVVSIPIAAVGGPTDYELPEKFQLKNPQAEVKAFFTKNTNLIYGNDNKGIHFRLYKEKRNLNDVWYTKGAIHFCASIQQYWQSPDVSKTRKDEESKFFEEMAVRWLLEREGGEPKSSEKLMEILGFQITETTNYTEDWKESYSFPHTPVKMEPLKEASPYWFTKLALSLTTSLDKAELLKILLKILNKALSRDVLIKILEEIFGKEVVKKALSDSKGDIEKFSNKVLSRDVLIKNLEEIFGKEAVEKALIEKAIEILCNSHAEPVVKQGLPRCAKLEILKALLIYYENTNEPPVDPLLKGEILLNLAFLSMQKAENAEKELKQILEPSDENRIRDIINERLKFKKGDWNPAKKDTKLLDSELKHYQGSAQRLLAQIHLRQAGVATNPIEKCKELDEAFKLLRKAHENEEIYGLELLAVKQQIAELFIQLASILEDLASGSSRYRVGDLDMGAFKKGHNINKKIYINIDKFLAQNGITEDTTAEQLTATFNKLIEIPNLIQLIDDKTDIPQTQQNKATDQTIIKNKQKLAEIYPLTFTNLIQNMPILKKYLEEHHVPAEKTSKVLLSWARRLTQDIQEWHKEYSQKVEKAENQPPWLKEIVSSSIFSEVQIRLIEGKYTEAKEILKTEIIEKTDLYSTEIIGQANLRMAGISLDKEKNYNEAKGIVEQIINVKNLYTEETVAKAELLNARILLEDEENYTDAKNIAQEIINKENIYDKTILTEANLLKAKAIMVEAGEGTETSYKDYIIKQESKLKEAETILELLKDEDVDSQTKAEIKRILAENLIRQGFILMDKGYPNFQVNFKNAKKLLEEAISQGDDYTQASARVWMAKILTVEAGKIEDKTKKSKLLEEAEKYVLETDSSTKAREIRKDIIDNLGKTELSSAYQTWGDILVAQDKFGEAAEKYQKALENNDANLEARASLGDTYNWLEKYDEAAKEYDKVIKHPKNKENSLADLRARLGKAEVTLRKEKEINKEVEKIVETVQENTLPASQLILRAKKFLLEIADIYIDQKEYEKAETLLSKIINDPTITNPIKVLAQLRFGHLYDKSKQTKQAEENFRKVQQYCKEKTELTFEEKLAYTEVLTYFKNYKEALNIYTELLANPALDRSEESEILVKSGEIYTYDWEGRDFEKAEECFRIVALDYWNTKLVELEEKEKLLWAKALFGMGEMRRYGNQRDPKLASIHYQKAIDILSSLAKESTEVKGIKGKSYYGLAKAWEMLGNRVAAQKAILKASEYKESIPDEKSQKAVSRSKVQMADPLFKITHQKFEEVKQKDKEERVEYQENYQLNVPITDHLDVTGRLQVDRGPGAKIYSLYPGLRIHDIMLGESTALSVEVAGKAYSGADYDNPQGTVLFFKQPDLITSLSLWNKYISAQLSTTHDLRYPELNVSDYLYLSSLYANTFFSFSSITYNRFLAGLQLGAETNWYKFYYDGSGKERAIFSPSAKYVLNFENFDLPDQLDFIKAFKIRLYGNWPYIEYIPNPDPDSGETNWPIFHTPDWYKRFRAGAGLDVNLGQWEIPIIVSGDLEYTRQYSYTLRGKQYDYAFRKYQITADIDVLGAAELVKPYVLKAAEAIKKFWKKHLRKEKKEVIPAIPEAALKMPAVPEAPPAVFEATPAPAAPVPEEPEETSPFFEAEPAPTVVPPQPPAEPTPTEQVALAPAVLETPPAPPPPVETAENRTLKEAMAVLGEAHWKDLGSPSNYSQLVAFLKECKYKVDEKESETIIKAAKEYKEEYFIYEEKSALSVNLTTHRHDVVNLDRRKGEEQLYALADTEKVEEGWLYIEYEKEGESFAQWFECGTQEEQLQASFNYYIIPKLSRQKAKIHRATFYHIHPEPINPLPSDKDLIAAAKIAKDLRKNWNYQEDLDFAVVSPKGKFILTPKPLKDENRFAELITEARKIVVTANLLIRDPKQTAEEMSNKALQASFYPRNIFIEAAYWVGFGMKQDDLLKEVAADKEKVELAFTTLFKAFNSPEEYSDLAYRRLIPFTLIHFASELKNKSQEELKKIGEAYREYTKIKGKPSLLGKALFGDYLEEGLLGEALPELLEYFSQEKIEDFKKALEKILKNKDQRESLSVALEKKEIPMVNQIIEQELTPPKPETATTKEKAEPTYGEYGRTGGTGKLISIIDNIDCKKEENKDEPRCQEDVLQQLEEPARIEKIISERNPAFNRFYDSILKKNPQFSPLAIDINLKVTPNGQVEILNTRLRKKNRELDLQDSKVKEQLDNLVEKITKEIKSLDFKIAKLTKEQTVTYPIVFRQTW